MPSLSNAKLLERISEIETKIDGLYAKFDSEIARKAVLYDEIMTKMKSLSFDVSSVAKMHDEKGNDVLMVNYGRPTSSITITPNKEVFWEAFAAAMHELDLVTYEGMQKIADAINDICDEK